ncbi:TPA: hypothetical protein JBI13_15350 [Legionella pneumophila]|nr:hypothetical protein [Legionella pneumophila]
MTNFTHFEECFFCNLIFKYGRHHYLGKYLPKYQITVCDRCYNENPKGWNSEAQKKLFSYLESKGLSIPNVDEKGLIPRDPPSDNGKMKTIKIKIPKKDS